MGRPVLLSRIAAWLCGVVFALCLVPAQAQLVLPGSFYLSPSSATGGGTISIGASRLADGHYEVLLLEGRGATTLVDIPTGTGEFQRYVKLPALAAGTYTVELRVGGRLQESRSYKILAPLSVTTGTNSPKAGSTLTFSVSGLTAGSLSLLYAGKTAFGPVTVEAGSYSGKFVVPTDRPASLPASVTLTARNAVGKTIPRVGSRVLSVQLPDRNPLVRLTSSTLSSSSVSPRQSFSITGSLATNEMTVTETDVQYWWRGSDGRVVPMGKQRAVVATDGSFSATMRAPSLGTLSAQQAYGTGTVFGVGKARDKYGLMQHDAGAAGSPLTSVLDTDAAIDVNLILRGSDGKPVEGARVVLSSAQLDELYPPNDNTSPIRMDGGLPGVPTQYGPPAANDAVAGCPDDLERQTTNGIGQAKFEFGVDVPAGGMDVSGGGPAPSLTIEPTQECQTIPANPPNGTAQHCTLVDPAGIHATLTVISSHTGYGWLRNPLGPNDAPTEAPLTIKVRVDRYTGRVTTETCPPDVNTQDNQVPTCDVRDFDRSANLSLTLPLLQSAGLLLSDPTWTQGADTTWPRVASRDGLILDYEVLPDLSAFEGRATFSPATPYPRSFQIGYIRGAGNTLSRAVLNIPGVLELELDKVSGSDSCDVSATELWRAPVPASFLQSLRFPGRHWNNNSLWGWVKVYEANTNRTGVRYFRFNFAGTPPAVASLASRAGIAVNLDKPHWARVTLPPQMPVAETSTGNGNLSGCDDTGSTDCDAISELKSKKNEADAVLDQQFCLPVGETRCQAISHADSVQQIHSRQSDNPPSGATYGGAGAPPSRTGRSWETLFDKTIPLFRWYWGVPELLSAEVFADLALKAEYLLNYVLKPLEPLQSYVETGGRLNVSIMIGVDVDVLFGILVDAGAAITGYLHGEVVAVAKAEAPTSPCLDERLNFGMYFSYWVEIGCPFPNPFDPTCYIPDIEGSHTIFDKQILDGASCLANKQGAAGAWRGLEASLAALGTAKGTLPVGPVMAVSPEQRRALNRHTAISIDGAGNRLSLFLDREWGDLVAADVPVDGAPSRFVLRKAYGLRDVAVMHYGEDRAVAVWAQSDLQGPPAAGVDLASRQHLVWSSFDGETWKTPVRLTNPGFGEGGVRLARCQPNPLRYRTDCVNDKVALVFQRNTARTMGGESHIYLSRFDGDSWTAPVRVDQSGTHNITPAVAYQNAQPVVAWVRYAPNAALTTDAQRLSSVNDRNLALRVMDGTGAEEVATQITRAAQPDLATTSSGRLALAYTRAASSDAFVGTRQALFLGERTCASGACSLRTFAVRDAHGRLLYGERPRIATNATGGIGVVFRALAFGAIPGAPSAESNLLPGDPAGILNTHGELLSITSKLTAGQTVVQNLSNDGGGHFQASVAFDPVSQELVAMSGVLPAGVFKSDGAEPARLLAKLQTVDEGVQLASLPDLPDLGVETLASPATQLTPGANIEVSIGLFNGGSDWTPDTERRATLRLYWDTPATRETLYGNVEVAALAPGARRRIDLQIPVPAAFSSEQRQTLRAELLIEDEDGELDGANNAAALSIGGLPVPANLQAFSVPGSRIVNLTWDDPQDPRVAGYRIWVDDANGTPQPLGSSFNPGFADVSALFRFTRTYRVSTYSARGIESELSAPLQAEPSLAIVDEALGPSVFRNGFE